MCNSLGLCSAIAYEGRQFIIEFALDSRDASAARDFYESLDDRDKAGLLVLFKRLGDHGRIKSVEKFRKIEDGLWEFKKYQTRLLGDFRPGGRFIICHGLTKKSDKHKRKDLEVAHRLLQEYDVRVKRR